MPPSDEKPPVAGMPPFADVSNNGPVTPLKNPLHEMYGQSKPADTAPSTAAASPQVGASATDAPAAGTNGPQPQWAGQPVLHDSAQAHVAGHEPSAADEQAWVEKTKAAIAQTQNDPYRRVQLLQELRAAYLAARFNKPSSGMKSS